MDRHVRPSALRLGAAGAGLVVLAAYGASVPRPVPAPAAPVAVTISAPTALVPGLTLSQSTIRNGLGQNILVSVLSADLGEPTLRPAYLGNAHLTDTAKLSTMANNAKAVGAVNGDLFAINSTKAPDGAAITGGKVLGGRARDHTNVAAFFANGAGNAAVMTQLFLEAKITTPWGVLDGTNLNSPFIIRGGIGVYNQLWGSASRTATTTDATKVREVEIANGAVIRISTTAGSGVASGSVVLLGIDAGADALAALRIGDRASVNYRLTDESKDATTTAHTAIAGERILLRDGAVVAVSDGTRNARTAIGFSSDGLRVWLVTADKKYQGNSVAGLDFPEMATVLKTLGADDALNLDGGGSTDLVARLPGDATVSVINTPSDSAGERAIPNGIGFTSTALICTSPAPVFGAMPDGKLYQYPLNNAETDTSSWSARFQIGAGWNMFGRVLGGPDGRFYGITTDTAANPGMYRYRRLLSTNKWEYNSSGSSATLIRTDFGRYAEPAWRDKISVDSIGDFYAIDTAGNLRWYRYDEASGVWTIDGQVIDTGWNQFDLIVAADRGVLYARSAADGTLYRYRFDPDQGSWVRRFVHVGDGWQMHTRGIFSVGGDTLFGIQGDGDLYQYRYLEFSGRWAIVARDIGSGWHDFGNAVATTDSCRLAPTLGR